MFSIHRVSCPPIILDFVSIIKLNTVRIIVTEAIEENPTAEKHQFIPCCSWIYIRDIKIIVVLKI